MSPDIWIDDDVLDAIKQQAIPFEDHEPNDVLRRVLLTGSTERPGKEPATAAHEKPQADLADRPAPAPASSRRAAASASSRTRGKTRTRVSSSALLPEANYRLPILRALSDAGGRMATSEAIAAVGEIVYDQLMAADLELQGNKPRWQQRIQFTRLRLIDDELMKKDSPRGMWEISEAGEQMVRGSIKSEAVNSVRAKHEAATA
jgi:hypothetical protein